MPTPTELRDISTAMYEVDRPYSPIPAGDLRDALTEVLTVTVGNHHLIPATDESVALCRCGDEWVCAEVKAVRDLAQVITRMARDEATRANNGWRI